MSVATEAPPEALVQVADRLLGLPDEQKLLIADLLEQSITQADRRTLAQTHLMDFARYVDPSYFPARHLAAIAGKLEAVERGAIRKLMIFVPPRYGKSELTSVKFPAWYLGRHPDRRIIHTSYAAALSNTFSRRTRNLLADTRYQELFDVRLAADSMSVEHWNLQGQRGGFISAGLGGAITGHGANVFIIDDPIKDQAEADSAAHREAVWEWYGAVARTRLEPDAAMVLIMTRWHDDDLAGRLLKQGGWTVVNLPVLAEEQDLMGRAPGEPLWPERYTLQAVLEIKAEVPPRVWEALFRGQPRVQEGQLIKRDWFQWFTELPPGCERFGGIDTATSLKTSADHMSLLDVCRDAPGYLYVDEVLLERLTVRGFSKHVSARHAAVGYRDIQIEENAAGEAVKQAIEEQGREDRTNPPVHGFKTSTDKVVRVSEFSHLIENGTLKFKRGNPRVAALVEHLINFDGKGSDIDDDVDALGFAIRAARGETRTQLRVFDTKPAPRSDED